MSTQFQTNSSVISEKSPGSSIFSPSKSSGATLPNFSHPGSITVAEFIVKILVYLGVNSAFGVSGGGIGPLWANLSQSPLQVVHFRHETGAAFAAIESYFASDRPTVVFTTTGPGITNALTGLLAARGEGAKVILLSASTSVASRGRWACQETSPYTMPQEGIFTSSSLFHFATVLESGEQLPEIARRLSLGLTKPGGFVAHISIPTAVQTSPALVSLPPLNFSRTIATVSQKAIDRCTEWLTQDSFAIWLGFGARHAALPIRQLAERTGAAVMCSPRAKGIFPETHPQFIGVTGFAGHSSVLEYMEQHTPQRILVLGTRLGEPTSFWNPAMIPPRGFIHVDLDPEVPGVAYPSVETHAIQSEIGDFVTTLLQNLAKDLVKGASTPFPRPQLAVAPSSTDSVRPAVLMEAIQQQIVRDSDALIMADAGNSFAWATHLLQFERSNRYRISTGIGAMGHAATGVVGAALGSNRKAVAIVGDGSMLMNCEISTAVKLRVPTVWLVLNDASYNMCAQGAAMQGFSGVDTEIPQADFVQIARGMGANGICVRRESELAEAIEQAMASPLPFVVDIRIDPNQKAPIGGRINSLKAQGAKI
ncbi:MAG: thiamine pyrophosphate-binding protein [Xenococcaceae cyanobacterium MO_188.B32]|nr:thiamine pyrophosphate-binding protein [Xenococcaceae cyanobacterium MO_188.B32]